MRYSSGGLYARAVDLPADKTVSRGVIIEGDKAFDGATGAAVDAILDGPEARGGSAPLVGSAGATVPGPAAVDARPLAPAGAEGSVAEPLEVPAPERLAGP